MTNNRTNATQLIKARTVTEFTQQLLAQSNTLRNRHMAYLGLFGEGAVLDTVGNVNSYEALKVGEKIEIGESPETLACNPTFIKSIHLVGEQIICNGDQNLFFYPQAEQIVRAVASFLRTTGATDAIFGGVPNGYGTWLLPVNGSPVSLSTFGFGWVLPYEGRLIARDLVSGGCSFLSPTNLTGGQYARQNWTSFYTPAANVTVVSLGHRVRNGTLFATLRTGANTMVESWDLRPTLQNKPVAVSPVQVGTEVLSTWGTEIVGQVEQGNALAAVSPTWAGITMWGVSIPNNARA